MIIRRIVYCSGHQNASSDLLIYRKNHSEDRSCGHERKTGSVFSQELTGGGSNEKIYYSSYYGIDVCHMSDRMCGW